MSSKGLDLSIVIDIVHSIFPDCFELFQNRFVNLGTGLQK
jgi:hypothetical protein